MVLGGGEHKLPTVSKYTYLSIDFQCNGAWDTHIENVVDNGRKKVNQLHSILSNRDINLSARRLLLFSVVRPTLEYGNEVWEGNKAQSASLESTMLGGAKRILGAPQRLVMRLLEVIYIGLETLQGRRDKAKLKWWYKFANMCDDRYPWQLFDQDWVFKPRRGRQRKNS